MAVFLSPFGPKPAFFDSAGDPLSGGKLYAYVAGSTTAQNTYTNSGGGTANANPIVLNSRGEPDNEIWLTESASYKFVLKTSADVTIWTVDAIAGINDTATTTDQWVTSGLTPTYVSATSFTLVGDQTTAFHVGRRLKFTDSTTLYGRITVSAYTSLTTVTVVLDTGSLSASLSAVDYGLVTATNTSLPNVDDDKFLIVDPSDKTKKVRIDAGTVATATTRVLTMPDADVTLVSNPGPTTLGKHTIWIPATAMTPTVSNGCATLTSVETTAGRPDMNVLDFDTTADEHAQFSVAMPKGWNLGTVTFQAWWTNASAVTTGVAWGLQGVAVSDNDTIDVAYGTAIVVTDDSLNAAEDCMVTAESAAVTIAGTPADDDICFFRVFRDVSDANDDLAEDARLIGIKLFITIDTPTDD